MQHTPSWVVDMARRIEWAGGLSGDCINIQEGKVSRPPPREAARKTPSSCRLIGGGRIGVEESIESAETTTTSVDGARDSWPVRVEKSLDG